MNNRVKDVIVVGFALFAMFLGAGNLIFPPYLGFHSGDNWGPVLIGFVLTGVGLPLLGVYSTLKSGGNVSTLGRYVGKRFSTFLGLAIILAIGPCFAIPRTAATVHEVAVMPFSENISPVVTSVIFFALVLYLSLNNSKVVDRIGQVLTPFLLLTLAAIIIAAVVHPLGTPVAVEKAYDFGGGFTEGYQTLDALAATMFAGVGLASILSRGYTDRKDQLNMTLKSGIIAAVLLALVYGGLLYAGAGASGAGLPEDIGRTTLLTTVTAGLLGNIGKYTLSVAVFLACLTTAVGLAVTCGQYFNTLSNKKLSYTSVVVACTLFSMLVSVMGVTFIINAAAPILYLMYPVLMVLMVFMAFDQFIPNKNAYIGGVIGAFLVSIVDALVVFEAMFETVVPGVAKLAEIKALLPLDSFGLGWVVPALVLAVLASFIPRKREDELIVDLKVFEEGTK